MKTLLTLMALLVVLVPAYAGDWEETAGGPQGGNVRAMAALDSTLLAVVEPGVIYRRESAGWARLAALDAREIKGADGIFMARTLDGFYRSTDRGATWHMVGSQVGDGKLVQDGETLYASRNSTLYRLSEQGGAWTQLAIVHQHFLTFFAYDSILFLSRSGDSAGLYRSVSRGATWERIQAGLPAGAVPVTFHRIGATLYMGTDLHGVFRSTDGGLTWNAINEGLVISGSYPSITALADVGGRLWASGYTGTYLYMNGQWYTRIRVNSRAMAVSGENVYIGTNNRVYRSGGTGDHWEQMNEGLKAHRIDALATFRNTVLAGANGMIYQSTDAGDSWLLSWNRPDEVSPVRFAGGDDTIYALDNHPSSAGIYRSEDGRAWEETGGEGLPYQIRYLSSLAVSGDTLFAGYYRTMESDGPAWVNGGVYRSIDGGEHWSPASNGLPRRGEADVPVYDLAAVGGVLLAQTMEGLYRSADGGASWSAVTTGFPENVQMRRFAVAGGTLYLAGIGGVYVSADAGATWSGMNNGFPQGLPVQYISVAGTTVYIATSFGGNDDLGNRAYRYTGGRWEDLGNQFPSGISPKLFVQAGDRVLAGTMWNSVWRGKTAPASVPHTPAGGAMDLVVSPNPFRSDLTASFTLREGGAVRLMLLSLTGEEIGTIHDGALESGLYEIGINGSALASGAYYLRIESPGGVQTVTVIKVR